MATALSLMSVVPAQAASNPVTSHLSATAAPLTVLRHSTVTISGVVTPRGTGVVKLQRYSAGKWIQVSHRTTTKAGRYSFAVTTSATLGTRIYRVTRSASSTAKAAVSRTLHVHVVKTAYKVKAAARPAVAWNTPIVVAGSVSPKVTGTVRLEVLQRGAWHDIATAKLSSTATFSLSKVEPTGVYALRVRSPLTTTIASGVSPSMQVTVTPRGTQPEIPAPTATISLTGTGYSGSVYVGDVTVTIAAADTGGPGIKSVLYSLDGAATKAYTGPITVTAIGSHTITVTVTDNAGNLGTASNNWSQLAVPDTTAPTASIALSGTNDGSDHYSGNVTATVTAGDETGGSGVKSVAYVLDSGASTPYAAPVVVSMAGSHTFKVTVTDNAGNVGTASTSWSQVAAADTTAPTASIVLSGTNDGSGDYTGDVTVTVTSADEVGGSGLKSTTYSLDGAAAKPYTGPITVSTGPSHSITVTVTDKAGNVGTASTGWNQKVGGASLVVTSPDDAVLATGSSRLVFSAVRGLALPGPRAFTFTNTGTSALTVSSLGVAGANAGDWTLAAGQASSVTIAAGGSAQVSLQFKPADPTGCPDSTNPTAISPNVDRTAALTYATDDPAQPTGSALLSGVDSCFVGGNNEPVLDQLLPVLGYTDVVDTPYIDRRFIGPARYLAGTDEIQSPYFRAADSSQPVTLTPLAHYGGPNTSTTYAATGWYAQGAAMSATSSCSSACKQLWAFPGDPSSTTYNQNQKLLPTPIGGTSFSPGGNFGIYSGDFSDVNFSDDSLNIAHTTSNTDVPTKHYLHDLRIFPAYGPGHVLIPNTYIVGIDITRVPAYKNNDYQDLILLLTNAQPATSQGRVLSASGDNLDLTKGGTVSASCLVTGFDGVMPSSIGANPCAASDIAFTGAGLQLTSTSGQLADHNQQNALYQTFDATRGAFTISTRVIGSTNQLLNNYQQIGAFFGPDDRNFIKVEAEHNGAPGLTLFYDENGVSTSAASASPAGLTSSSTLDLVIKGNTSVPDPLPYGDTYHVSGYPLDELTVWYSINGAPLLQIGSTIEFPANVTGWFSRQAKAGILVASPGTTTPITATFSSFAITAP